MRPLPGDPPVSDQKARMIRVNHAGEVGAVRIYEGQLAVLKGTKAGDLIEHMKRQEEVHADLFEGLLKDRAVTPTHLSPIWWVAGYALGYATARLSPQAAMACTVAVEEVIDTHYGQQEEDLANPHLADADLLQAIQKCRQEEKEHREVALSHGASQTPGYRLLTKAIRGATRVAIALSKRI